MSKESASDFDIDAYLNYRETSNNFAVVELGHRGFPITQNTANNFTGGRSYVGVEAWMRSAKNSERINMLLAELGPDQNVSFVDLSPDIDYEQPSQYLDTLDRYDARTTLSDYVADELVMSNVFGDPLISDESDRAEQLLASPAGCLTTWAYW